MCLSMAVKAGVASGIFKSGSGSASPSSSSSSSTKKKKKIGTVNAKGKGNGKRTLLEKDKELSQF